MPFPGGGAAELGTALRQRGVQGLLASRDTALGSSAKGPLCLSEEPRKLEQPALVPTVFLETEPWVWLALAGLWDPHLSQPLPALSPERASALRPTRPIKSPVQWLPAIVGSQRPVLSQLLPQWCPSQTAASPRPTPHAAWTSSHDRLSWRQAWNPSKDESKLQLSVPASPQSSL